MARVTVSYPSGEKKSYASPQAARADMAKQGYSTFNDKTTGGGTGTRVQGGGNINSGSGGGGGADSGQAAARGGGGTPQSVTINGRTGTRSTKSSRMVRCPASGPEQYPAIPVCAICLTVVGPVRRDRRSKAVRFPAR